MNRGRNVRARGYRPKGRGRGNKYQEKKGHYKKKENETNLILDQPLLENKTEIEKDFEKMKEDDMHRMNQNEGDLEQIKIEIEKDKLIENNDENLNLEDEKKRNLKYGFNGR